MKYLKGGGNVCFIGFSYSYNLCFSSNTIINCMIKVSPIRCDIKLSEGIFTLKSAHESDAPNQLSSVPKALKIARRQLR